MLNRDTRLAFEGDPASGALTLQGFEATGPATQALFLPGGDAAPDCFGRC